MMCNPESSWECANGALGINPYTLKRYVQLISISSQRNDEDVFLTLKRRHMSDEATENHYLDYVSFKGSENEGNHYNVLGEIISHRKKFDS